MEEPSGDIHTLAHGAPPDVPADSCLVWLQAARSFHLVPRSFPGDRRRDGAPGPLPAGEAEHAGLLPDLAACTGSDARRTLDLCRDAVVQLVAGRIRPCP